MKRASLLVVLAAAVTVTIAQGANKPNVAPPKPVPRVVVIPVVEVEYDFSGKALASNPALQKEIDETLIKAGACRSMASVGYGNGYQCPAPGLASCMVMLKAGKVDACAALTGRDYPTGCAAKDGATEATSPERRASSICTDLSADVWTTLAIRMPYPVARKRLESFGCKWETGTTFFCPSHLREWLCQPLERGGVVVCRPPKIVKVCGQHDVDHNICTAVET